jgi:hypothetical protein
MKRAAKLLMLAMLVAAGSVVAAPQRGGFMRGGMAPGRGFNQERRQDFRPPVVPQGPARPPVAEPGGRRMSPEDRERLRRDIRDNGQQIYRGRLN